MIQTLKRWGRMFLGKPQFEKGKAWEPGVYVRVEKSSRPLPDFRDWELQQLQQEVGRLENVVKCTKHSKKKAAAADKLTKAIRDLSEFQQRGKNNI